MDRKSKSFSVLAALGLSATMLAGTAVAGPLHHHSKAKGALVGGVAGHMVAGKKGAAVGAAAGALHQHHKNKKQGY